MNGQMLVATRKGLLQLARKNGGWSVERTSFAGIPVTAALHDARDGTLYAMLKHGHFGAKLHRSDDQGRNWTELAGPAVGRRAAGRAVRVPRPRRTLATCRRAMECAGAREMVRRRL